MSKKEILAYAITHAGRTPEGKAIKGGPYESGRGFGGTAEPSLRDACRWSPSMRPSRHIMQNIRAVVPDARVIRIVRKAWPSEEQPYPEYSREAREQERRLDAVLGAADARDSLAHMDPQPSEASAVEVLRELVRAATQLAGGDMLPAEDVVCSLSCFADEVRRTRVALDRARRVLASSPEAGPDPMPVVRAAMAWVNAVENRAKALRVNAQHQHFAEVAVADAERRLYAAQVRLAKIEKKVSRG